VLDQILDQVPGFVVGILTGLITGVVTGLWVARISEKRRLRDHVRQVTADLTRCGRQCQVSPTRE
jgi:hypothetical protein